MAEIELVLSEPLERGRCYTLTYTVEAVNPALSGSSLIKIGNATQKDILNSVNTPGTYTKDFTYTTTDTFYQSLFVTVSANFNLTGMSIKLDSDCALTYCSECFSLEECEEPEYLNLSWTNNDDGLGFIYTTMPLTHTLTIKGGLRNADYSYDEDYFTTSRGKHFPVYVDGIKQQEMWVERVPEYIHDALRLGIIHDSFTVNGVEYTKGEGGYSPDWDTPNSFLAPVIVRIRQKSQDTKNINC